MSDENLTGRDGNLINEALLYAAHLLDGLAEEYRPRGNRADMVRLLRTRMGEDGYLELIKRHSPLLEAITGRPLNVEDY